MWLRKKLYCWKCKLVLEVHTGTATFGSHIALKNLYKSRLSQQEEKNRKSRTSLFSDPALGTS